jgi:hypothetical protein
MAVLVPRSSRCFHKNARTATKGSNNELPAPAVLLYVKYAKSYKYSYGRTHSESIVATTHSDITIFTSPGFIKLG